ncbi:Mitochondrial-processing peptidase subunit alpha [Frankliniella fusca]|uniref:Mitochondrial-processing peptidase subunit alpha n=1 Tax=Frankliniella fusca TaxID=407009 RepID=A0AAE1HS42_9NEOP|nr:Mitochondrial-processing peptidase subunit alpha [Frankliniella fusca]
MASRVVGFQKFGTRFLAKQAKRFSWNSRHFASQADPPKIPIDRSELGCKQPPLSEPLPGVPTPNYATVKNHNSETKYTVLPNGLRIASETRFGQFCTVGVVIDSGSRYEVAYPSGVSHFLEKLAFNSTSVYSDREKIMTELENHGGICDCQSSRDTFVYAISADSRGLDAVSKILAEVVLRPQISTEEIDITRQAIQFELETLGMRPEQETLLMDMIHAAAYRDNTLGLPKLCPAPNIPKIDQKLLFTYLKNHFTPSRMVIAGVGVDHDRLVESVQKYFVDQKPVWEENDELILPGSSLNVDDSVAQWTGGLVQEECEIPQFAGPSGLPELAHVVLGLESCSHQDPDFIAVCVLNMMMGGGGSFSAGGPGKGMYTRLYTNVLNRYHWMYNATAYNHAYLDSGLFCIHASAPPTHVRELVEVITREMVAMAGSVGNSELRRAKTQLQSMLLMNLESRPVVFEDLARQVLATGQRKSPKYFIEAIENISADDIQRVAQRLLRSSPAVAARGDVSKIPQLRDVQSGLMDPNGRIPGSRHRMSLR